MKLTNEHVDMMYEAIISKAYKPREIKKEKIQHICAWINQINSELKLGQDNYRGGNIDNIMFPSNLSKFLEPLSIKFDPLKVNDPDLRDKDQQKYIKTVVVKETRHKNVEEFLHDYQELLKSKSDAKLEDVPKTYEVEVLKGCVPTLPKDYDHEQFKRDLNSLAAQMRVSPNLNTSLRSATREVAFNSIIDKIVFDGRVKWDDTTAGCFIPFFVIDGVSSLLNTKDGYNHTINEMLNRYFTENIVDILFN